METFFASLALCAGNSPATGEYQAQRPATRSFDVFLDLRLNKRLSKQSRGWWFEMPSHSLWRHCNVDGKRFPEWLLRRAYISLVVVETWAEDCLRLWLMHGRCAGYNSLFVTIMFGIVLTASLLINMITCLHKGHVEVIYHMLYRRYHRGAYCSARLP